MSARSPLICSAVELWYKKMLKIGSLSELTGIDTKIKVAGFQRLYSKWLWLLMAVYKPLFADVTNYYDSIDYLYSKWEIDKIEDLDVMLRSFEEKLGHKLSNQIESYVINRFIKDKNVDVK